MFSIPFENELVVVLSSVDVPLYIESILSFYPQLTYIILKIMSSSEKKPQVNTLTF